MKKLLVSFLPILLYNKYVLAAQRGIPLQVSIEDLLLSSNTEVTLYLLHQCNVCKIPSPNFPFK